MFSNNIIAGPFIHLFFGKSVKKDKRTISVRRHGCMEQQEIKVITKLLLFLMQFEMLMRPV